MTAEEFRSAVRSGKPEAVSSKACDEAIAFFLEQGTTRKEHIRACIQLAGRFDLYKAASHSDEGSLGDRLAPLTPDMLLRSDSFAEAIRPRVQQVRQRLFGTDLPPFASYEAAVQWLEQEAAHQRATPESSEGETRREAVRAQLLEYARLTGLGFRDPFAVAVLPYLKEGEVCSILISRNGVLATLEIETRRMAEATGFSQECVVAYVLADIEPLLAPYHIAANIQGSMEFGIVRTVATVTINTPTLTQNQCRTLLRDIRQFHGAEKKKAPNEADAKLCEIVAQHGGVPKDKGKGQHRKFWTQVRRAFNEWADTVQQKRHGSWNASRQRYKRLQQRHHVDVSPHKQLWNSFQRLYTRLKDKKRQRQDAGH